MYIHEQAQNTFVLLQSDWPVAQVRQLLERVEPTHVIIHRAEPEDTYYLYVAFEASRNLRHLSGLLSLEEALDLRTAPATPTVDAYTDAAVAPELNIIMEEGRVIGFVDRTILEERERGDKIRHYDGRYDLGPLPEPPTKRSLIAEFPEEVHLDEIVPLLVSLSSEPEAGTPLQRPLLAGATVVVLIQPQQGFSVEGQGAGSLVVPDYGKTLPLSFQLKATELGPGRIRILAFHQGQPIGAVMLAPTVVPAAQAVNEQRRSHEQPTAAMMSVPEPDLLLIIEESRSEGSRALTFRVSASDPQLKLFYTCFGSLRLHSDPIGEFQELFRNIEEQHRTTARDKSREKILLQQDLVAQGDLLFETILPKPLQEKLWCIRNRIQSVLVLSDEPSIPWELCKLPGKEGGPGNEGKFLCEAFAMVRWLPNSVGTRKPHPPNPTLTLKNIALVVPKDSGLTYAPQEADYVRSLAHGSRQVVDIPADRVAMLPALQSGEYDGWHFTGHGVFRAQHPDHSYIELENHERLQPAHLAGECSKLGLAHPLVFMNACQIGQSGMSLTGVGGWAKRFLDAGAAAFLAPLWKVDDQTAYHFAREFYSRLLAGMALGKAVQEARKVIKSSGDSTWLAYTVYGDPLGTVQR